MNILEKIINSFYFFQDFKKEKYNSLILIYFIPFFIYNYYYATIYGSFLSIDKILFNMNGITHFTNLNIEMFVKKIGILGIIGTITFFSSLYLYYFLLKDYKSDNFNIKYNSFFRFLIDNIIFGFTVFLLLIFFSFIFKLFLNFINSFHSIYLSFFVLSLYAIFLVFYLFYINGLYVDYLSEKDKIKNKFLYLLKSNINFKHIIKLNLKIKNFLISYLWFILGLKILSFIISMFLIKIPIVYALVSTFINFIIDLCFISFLLKLYIDNIEYYQN